MSPTPETLEQRVAALEQEVTALRRLVSKLLWTQPGEETPLERGRRLLRQATLDQPLIEAGWDKAMEQMGIHGQPIGAEKVQQMIAACGFKPEDNEFSRGIIEMREE
jgi:hypothetical protein